MTAKHLTVPDHFPGAGKPGIPGRIAPLPLAPPAGAPVASEGMRYGRNEAWTLEPGEGMLVVRGGADLAFGIDQISAELSAEVLTWWERGATGAASAQAAMILSQLCQLGALRLALGPEATPLKVFIRNVGEALPSLVAAVGGAVSVGAASPGVRLWDSAAGADLVVFVRTNTSLGRTAEAASSCRVPHLLVDAAYHHTVSLGPLVVPGETACLHCLAGRVGHAWADPPPPRKPAMTTQPQLIGALIANELAKIAAGDQDLVNRTVSLDLANYRVVSGSLLRLPWCPACGQPAPEGSCPDGSCPDGSCPDGSCPDGSCADGSCADGSCPDGSCADGSCELPWVHDA